MKIKLSIFIPAYNEEGNLEKVVNLALLVVGELVEDYEILIIDDGSKDATGEIADRLAENNPRIHVIHHLFNLGFGGAQKSGYLQSKLDYVMIIPADGQFDLRQIKDFVEQAEDYDIVAGYRKNRVDSLKRKINTWNLNILLRILFGLHIRDTQWVKLIKRSILKDVKLESRGAFVDAEILIKAKRRGYLIKEIATTHLPRSSGQSHGDNFWVVTMALYELLRLRWQFWRERSKGRP